MATTWAEIISNFAMRAIDDIKLNDESAENPAAFLRKMSLYMLGAVPMLNDPPELEIYLETGMTEASYADATWTSTATSKTQTTTVATENIGYTLFSCVIQVVDSAGNITVTPYAEATYDSTTGNVTFPIQSTEGVNYVMDFYNDGSFANDLSLSIKQLLGSAIAVLWDERFDNDWLANTMKIHDQSFNTPNESSYMNAKGNRHSRKRADFASDLRKYSQNCAAMQVIPLSRQQRHFM